MLKITKYKLFSRVENYWEYPEWYTQVTNYLTFRDEAEDLTHQFYREEGFFLAGFHDSVCQHLHTISIPVEEKFLDWDITASMPDLPFNPDMVWGKLRPHQQWAVKETLPWANGIIKLPTRFGKTFVMGGVYYLSGRPRTLILVPTKDIMHQTHADLTTLLEQPVGRIGDGLSDIQHLTIATSQSIVDKDGAYWDSVLPVRLKYHLWLSQLESIIWDEIHVHGRMFVAINEAAYNAIFRYGYSATPLVGKTWWDMSAVGYLGPIRLHVPSVWAAHHGIIEQCKSFWWAHPYTPDGDASDWVPYYKHNIVNNTSRNKLIVRIAKNYLDENKNLIIFVNHAAHGQKLQRMLPDSVFLSAKGTGKKRREEVKDKFNSGEIKCVIVTKLWRLGITVYADAGICAEGGRGGKLGQNNVQMLGRGLMPKGQVFHWNDIFDYEENRRYLGKLGNQSVHRFDSIAKEGWPMNIVTTDSVVYIVKDSQEVVDILLTE